MDLAHISILINEFLNKDPDIVPESAPLIILDGKSDVCISNNVKYTNNKNHIARRVRFVRNGEKCKMHNIGWCEGGLKLVDIVTKNVGDDDLNPIMKYIMVSFEN